MAEVRLGADRITLEPGETVLDGLLRNGLDVPYSCKKGTCLTCVARATDGTVPEAARAGLKDTLVALGYFLPCLCRPDADLRLEPARDSDLYGRATIDKVETLAPSTFRVLLRPATPLYYHAGQFVNLRRADGLVRSYSLASVPRHDPLLELHVRCLPGGAMSGWLRDTARPGHDVDLQGPNGSCFYLPGRPDQPMLLIGTGTGLAPLIGIARDALADGHGGAVTLYHGSRTPAGLYLGDDLRALEARYRNFRYVPCLSGPGDARARAARADAAALADHGDLKGYRVFVCGVPDMVSAVRRAAYMAGTSLGDIHGDPFDLRDRRRQPRA